MARCEDFPCCGHQVSECPTDTKPHNCKECGRSFIPDSMTWDYCYPCGQRPVRAKMPKLIPVQNFCACENCFDYRLSAMRRALRTKKELAPITPGEIYEAEFIFRDQYLCEGCADDAQSEWANDREYDDHG